MLQAALAITLALAGAWWVVRDARSRGMHGAPWGILTFLALIVGLPVYLLIRPRGKLSDCRSCGGKMLESLDECPRCGERRDGETAGDDGAGPDAQ